MAALDRSGRPAAAASSTSWSWPPPRAARRAPTGQPSSRRAANPRTPTELSSAHCTSSTANRSGDSAARRRSDNQGSRPRCADPRPRPWDRPGAVRTSSARRFGPGSRGATQVRRSRRDHEGSQRALASDLAGLDRNAEAALLRRRFLALLPRAPSSRIAIEDERHNPTRQRVRAFPAPQQSSPRPMDSPPSGRGPRCSVAAQSMVVAGDRAAGCSPQQVEDLVAQTEHVLHVLNPSSPTPSSVEAIAQLRERLSQPQRTPVISPLPNGQI